MHTSPSFDLSDLIISSNVSHHVKKPLPADDDNESSHICFCDGSCEHCHHEDTSSEIEHKENESSSSIPLVQGKAIASETLKADESVSESEVQESIDEPREDHPSLSHVFNINRDASSNLPYHMDHNPAMEKPSVRRKRQALRHSNVVLSKISDFKKVFTLDPKKTSVSKDEYARVHSKIARALYPTITENMIKKLCDDDWLKDSGGKDFITPEELDDVIFELVDIWTQTVDEHEYAQFLEVLAERVRFEGSNNPKAYSDVLPELGKKKKKKSR
ncbi:hypothetical protein GEMRC1_002447 [Eukaryota sp. GEM-RC1]